MLFRSGTIRPSHLTTRARFGAQLHRRLEEIDVQPHGSIQLGQLAIGTLTFEAVVADELPYNRAIFLFDKAGVVLVADPPAGEGELLTRPVRQQFFVDELTAVVRVDPQYGKRGTANALAAVRARRRAGFGAEAASTPSRSWRRRST